MMRGEQGRDRRSHGMAGDDRAIDVHGIEEGEGVDDQCVDAVVVARLARLAVAALGERQRAQSGRQMRQQRQKRMPAVGQAVQQQQGCSRQRAVLDVFYGHAGGEGGVLDLRVHPLLLIEPNSRSSVVAGLVPAIHAFLAATTARTWMPGT